MSSSVKTRTLTNSSRISQYLRMTLQSTLRATLTRLPLGSGPLQLASSSAPECRRRRSRGLRGGPGKRRESKRCPKRRALDSRVAAASSGAQDSSGAQRQGMAETDDLKLLALLVHRGQLERAAAEKLFAESRSTGRRPLDLAVSQGLFTHERLDFLRRMEGEDV